MTEIEKEQINAGAHDIHKQLDELERQIRKEVEKDLSHLTPAAREAVVQSRLKVISTNQCPELKKVDLGVNAGKKAKDNLFE